MSQARNLLAGETPKLKRTFLKDQVVDLLRDRMIYGDIEPGARLSEKHLANTLGVSRMPVRDALLELEREGLVVSTPGGRRLVELTERDVIDLYTVRLALEGTAVELAAHHRSKENQDALLARLEQMRDAVGAADAGSYVRSDIEIHRLIWTQAENEYLLKALDSIMSPLLMFQARAAERFDWNETLQLHEDLVGCIGAGNVPAAQRSIELHLQNSRQRALQIIHKRK